MTIRPLNEADALEYRLIRLRMLREHPESFGASADAFEAVATQAYEETFAERIAPPDRFILGAFLEGALVGTAGFYRQTGEKTRHKGGIWGMYVAPEARGRGIGRKLIDGAVAHAAATCEGLEQVQLEVVTENEAATALYAAAGFERYGTERRALKLGRRYLDEELLVRFL